ncbi:hypothetical protein A2U01_0089504, partial [Trifolium medium]|nr:hypothetical protein [Trifolium medium]
ISRRNRILRYPSQRRSGGGGRKHAGNKDGCRMERVLNNPKGVRRWCGREGLSTTVAGATS